MADVLLPSERCSWEPEDLYQENPQYAAWQKSTPAKASATTSTTARDRLEAQNLRQSEATSNNASHVDEKQEELPGFGIAIYTPTPVDSSDHFTTLQHPYYRSLLLASGAADHGGKYLENAKRGMYRSISSKGSISVLSSTSAPSVHSASTYSNSCPSLESYDSNASVRSVPSSLVKRFLCIYDGDRSLCKDDLIMHNEFEIRMKLAESKNNIADLDVETLKRAEGLNNATEEEKSSWVQEQPTDLEALMGLDQSSEVNTTTDTSFPCSEIRSSIQAYHSSNNLSRHFDRHQRSMLRIKQFDQCGRGFPSNFNDETAQKGRCPHTDCGRVFKDLKAHMLTHQSERPEKCPMVTCEYNQKGFARKYDKNRHVMTHYKGKMVCGFCPGSGSAAGKSFNRADVFKRHLTSVHGVEQTPPNSRKRSPKSERNLSSYCADATGKCSNCLDHFANAQDFYEHLDDCVLRVVQQEDSIESQVLRKLQEKDVLVSYVGGSAITRMSDKSDNNQTTSHGQSFNVLQLDSSSGRESFNTIVVPQFQGAGQNQLDDAKVTERTQAQKQGILAVSIKTEDYEACLETVELASPVDEINMTDKHGLPFVQGTADPETPSSSLDSNHLAITSNHSTPQPSTSEGFVSRSLKPEEDCHMLDWQSPNSNERAAESEGELSFMTTPAPEDLYDDTPAPLDPAWIRVRDSVAQQLSVLYVKLLMRAKAAVNQRGQSEGYSTPSGSSNGGSSSSRTTPSSGRSFAKRRLSSIEEEREDADGEKRHGKRPKPNGKHEANEDGKLLACPYAKYDPVRYSEQNATEKQYRRCTSSFLTTIPRLKQHLYRTHMRPPNYCSCCFQDFDESSLLEGHIRARSCVILQCPFNEKMTVQQMTEIKRRTPGAERSKSWFTIYRILFPQAVLPRSPFTDTFSEDFVQNFLDFFEREAPRRLAAAVRQDLGNTSPMSFDERLNDVLEESVSRVVRDLAHYAQTSERLRELSPNGGDQREKFTSSSTTEAGSPYQNRQASYQHAEAKNGRLQEEKTAQDHLDLFTFVGNMPQNNYAHQPHSSTFFADMSTESDFVDPSLIQSPWPRGYFQEETLNPWGTGLGQGESVD